MEQFAYVVSVWDSHVHVHVCTAVCFYTYMYVYPRSQASTKLGSQGTRLAYVFKVTKADCSFLKLFADHKK